MGGSVIAINQVFARKVGRLASQGTKYIAAAMQVKLPPITAVLRKFQGALKRALLIFLADP